MINNRRQKSRLKRSIPIIIFTELLIIAGILAYSRFALPQVKTVTVEAGTLLKVSAKDFIADQRYKASLITNLSAVDTARPSVYLVELKVNGRRVTSNIRIVDTTAPKATVTDLTIWKGETRKADDFVEGIEDASKVTVQFEQQPDFTQSGTQQVKLLLQDSEGNQALYKAVLTVKEDKEPPVIHGTEDKVVTIGDSVFYKKGVSVTDNKDEKLDFSVDTGAVNLKKEGTYTVTYTAKDSAGNNASVKIHVTVRKAQITEAALSQLCDGVLAEIVEADMSKRETAYAIYRWIKNNIGYSGDSDKSDWVAEAYRGITEGFGDCFTYYATAQALLTRAGIDNMRVTRVGGRTKHYWNLVNCGEGWYHFDSCPNKDHKPSFMLIDKEVEAYTKERGNNYYTFDKTLYPATPVE